MGLQKYAADAATMFTSYITLDGTVPTVLLPHIKEQVIGESIHIAMALLMSIVTHILVKAAARFRGTKTVEKTEAIATDTKTTFTNEKTTTHND